MNTDITTYVDHLFKGYEETPDLQDFKEEISSNMSEKINDLEQSGMRMLSQ
ncbi:MAG TPA: hypothetical protein VF095_11670 [Bacillota bacterium]